MATFSPIQPPKDPAECPAWLYEALRGLNTAALMSGQAVSAITRGESPDGSGGPLIDTSTFFYKPGIAGGQIAHGDTYAGGKLVLSSTAAATKGYIYLGTALTSMFDEANQRIGLNITPLYRWHSKHTAVETMQRWEGPDFSVTDCICDGTTTVTHGTAGFTAVTNGMIVTGPGVPSNTVVVTAVSSSQFTTNNAMPNSTITLNFALRIDLGLLVNGSGTDAFIKIPTALQIITGDLLSGIRFTVSPQGGDERAFLESGLSAGVNENQAFTGFNGATGRSSWHLYTYTSFNTWNGTVLQNAARVGINLDPLEYRSSSTANQPGSLGVRQFSGGEAASFEAVGNTNSIVLSVRTASAGSSPTKILGDLIFYVKDNLRVGFMNAAGGGVYLAGSSGNDGTLTISGHTTDLSIVNFAAVQAAWSDSRNTMSLQLSNLTPTSTTGGSNSAAMISSLGFGVLQRLGISSLYTLFSNAQVANADFVAPSSAPEVVHILNSSSANGNNDAVLLKVTTRRSGQTANLTEWINSAGAVVAQVSPTGSFNGPLGIVAYEDEPVFYEDEAVWA